LISTKLREQPAQQHRQIKAVLQLPDAIQDREDDLCDNPRAAPQASGAMLPRSPSCGHSRGSHVSTL